MEQTRKMLGRAKRFYSEICDFYEALAKETSSERVRMLLHYMAGHQKYLEEKINEFEKGASQTAMDTWYQAVPDDHLFKFLKELKKTPNMNIDQVVELGLKANKEITDFYRHLAENSELEAAKEIFSSLLMKQEEESHNLVRDAHELNDL